MSLIFGDGLKNLKNNEVLEIQKLLSKFIKDISLDGEFGNQTKTIVQIFQIYNDINDTGIVDNTILGYIKKYNDKIIPTNDTFRGDYDWIHTLEGHKGSLYWPEGESGITIDPGVDLRFVEKYLFIDYYKNIIKYDSMYYILKHILRKKINSDKDAKNILDEKLIKSISITKDNAKYVFKKIVLNYWNGVVKRFPILLNTDIPNCIHTVMLSLGYNRGVNNKDLDKLHDSINNKDWVSFGNIVQNMQQNHKLNGIRRRRRLEGELVLNYIKKENTKNARTDK